MRLGFQKGGSTLTYCAENPSESIKKVCREHETPIALDLWPTEHCMCPLTVAQVLSNTHTPHAFSGQPVWPLPCSVSVSSPIAE